MKVAGVVLMSAILIGCGSGLAILRNHREVPQTEAWWVNARIESFAHEKWALVCKSSGKEIEVIERYYDGDWRLREQGKWQATEAGAVGEAEEYAVNHPCK